MAKEKIEIDFHGKKRGLLEAKLHLCGLKMGIVCPNLNQEEKDSYLDWKNIEEDRNSRIKELLNGKPFDLKKKTIKKIIKEPTERRYITQILENKIDAAEKIEKKKYCEKYGHKERENSAYTQPGIEGAVTHYTCERCESTYEKK